MIDRKSVEYELKISELHREVAALRLSLRDVGEKFTTIASDSSWMLKNLVEAQLIPNCDKVEIVERLNELEEVLSRLSTDTKEVGK